MNSQITASRAVQHCAELQRSADAARRAKAARAARPAARKAESVHMTPKLIGRLLAGRTRTAAVPVVARPRPV
jgi:hypothetical protein